MSPYRIATDLTIYAIERRAKQYRRLIVAAVFITFISIASSLIAGSITTLFGLTVLFPACSLFFFRDNKVLNQWRLQLFDLWVKKEINFCYFLEAIGAISALPKETVNGMLNSLPPYIDSRKEQKLSSATRESIATVSCALDNCRSDSLAVKAVSFFVGACSIIAAANLWLWQPLLFLWILPLLFLLERLLRRKHLKQAHEAILLLRQNSEFDGQTYHEYAKALDWSLISSSAKDAFLALAESDEPSYASGKKQR